MSTARAVRPVRKNAMPPPSAQVEPCPPAVHDALVHANRTGACIAQAHALLVLLDGGNLGTATEGEREMLSGALLDKQREYIDSLRQTLKTMHETFGVKWWPWSDEAEEGGAR